MGIWYQHTNRYPDFSRPMAYWQCLQACTNQTPTAGSQYWQGGVYSSTTNYVVGNLATYNDVGYVNILACTNILPTNTTYWEPLNIFLKSKPEFITPMANNAYTHNHGNTPAIQTSFAIDTWGNGGYLSTCPHQHSHVFTGSTAQAIDPFTPNPAWLSFRIWEKPLGQMVPYNDAVSNQYTNGLYYSPPLQLNVASFGQLYFNAAITGTDQINVYFRTAATQQALGAAQTWDSSSTTWDSANPYDYLSNGIACTCDHTTGYFNAPGHGLSNGNRISLTASTIPTGLSQAIMYYVLVVDANNFQVSLTNGGSAVTFTTNGSGVEAFQWFDEISISGTTISATPNIWVQYAIEFKAADTRISNPTVYTANEFMLKFGYSRVGALAETAVEFIYTTGRMNYGEPYVDKIFKRLASDHTGSAGQVKITWATENATNGWTFDLSAYPNKWTAFFQDSAMGETLSITYYKNDLNDMNIRQFKGQYTQLPMII